jgi:hypothetical protein
MLSNMHAFSATDISNTLFSFALLGAGGGGAPPTETIIHGLSVQANMRKTDFSSSEVATVHFSFFF